jgi:phospholipase C
VALQCTSRTPDSGSALVNGSTFDCATFTSATASPAETTVGGSITLGATAVGPNPGGLTYSWSAPFGTFGNANAATTTFTCTTPGMIPVTLTVGDGPVPAGASCDTSLDTTTIQVACDGHLDQAAQFPTATKIKHIVVLFPENISYDHYFGTYPVAQNAGGETPFVAAPGTPVGNGLTTPLDPTHGFGPLSGVNLITNNPVAANPANGAGAVNPFRLAPTFAATSDMGHNYKPEQQADNNGAMDLFPLFTGTAAPPPPADAGAPAATQTKGLVMAYYDGNTLGAYWNYAQNYAMNDNSFSTVFGPSTPGAINLISGQTNGFGATNKNPATMSASHVVADGAGNWTLIGDTDPLGDVCSVAGDQNLFTGKNIGDFLNAKGISWGFFEGGFDLTLTNANGTTGCARNTPQTVPFATGISADYIPHHQPFQYYPSTANPTHARPSSVTAIGKSVETDGVTPEPANHQYDSHDFFDALSAGNLPAVSYVKAPAFQDGHPGYSNPIDEQNFTVSVVNALQASQEWSSTLVVVLYDDSDGWYDHQMPPIVNPSATAVDQLNGPGLCNSGAQQGSAAPTTPLLGAPPAGGGAPVPVQGRCGYGTRQPLLVISPFAKRNYIDHTLTDQTSVLRFVEDNWLGGQRIQPGGSFDTIAGTIQNMLNP